jgi:hypothetical protein
MNLISEEEAYEMLIKAIEATDTGTMYAYAKKVGVTDTFIHRMVHRTIPITGKVLRHLGLERTTVRVYKRLERR